MKYAIAMMLLLTSFGAFAAPTALTLNEPGDYAGIIESDVEFLPNRRYTAVVTIGTEPNSRAVFNVDVRPVERGKD